MVPKPTALLCGCSLWPGEDPHDTCSTFFSSSREKSSENNDTGVETTKDTWSAILDRQTIDNDNTMPSLRPFRKSESSHKGELSTDDTQQPKRGSMRGLFGKKKKDKNNVLDETVDLDSLAEDPTPVLAGE